MGTSALIAGALPLTPHSSTWSNNHSLWADGGDGHLLCQLCGQGFGGTGCYRLGDCVIIA